MKRQSVALIVCLLAWLPGLEPASAAAPATGAARHLVAGKPDWTGVWSFVNGPLTDADGEFTVQATSNNNDPTSPLVTAPMPKFKGPYLDIYNARIKSLREDHVSLRDDGAKCLPSGMPRFWASALAYEITHTPTQINILAEFMTHTRRLYLDGRSMPADYEPTYSGHSTGRWEGETLVVETRGIRADSGIGIQYEGEHSAAIRVIERFTPRFSAGRDVLEIEVRTEDPEAFVEPWVVRYALIRKPGWEIKEELCTENNRTQVGDDGSTQIKLGTERQ